jgi:hypothetical protein
MRRFVHFVRRRGVANAASIFLALASILFGAAFSYYWGNLWIPGLLCAFGASLVMLAIVCFIIGPAEQPPSETIEISVDPNPDINSEGNVARDDQQEVEVEVQPDMQVRIRHVPPGMTVHISGSEEEKPDGDEHSEEEAGGS